MSIALIVCLPAIVVVVRPPLLPLLLPPKSHGTTRCSTAVMRLEQRGRFPSGWVRRLPAQEPPGPLPRLAGVAVPGRLATTGARNRAKASGRRGYPTDPASL
eukprot:6349549-Lingulodinium_polyedra.AAC.1